MSANFIHDLIIFCNAIIMIIFGDYIYKCKNTECIHINNGMGITLVCLGACMLYIWILSVCKKYKSVQEAIVVQETVVQEAEAVIKENDFQAAIV